MTLTPEERRKIYEEEKARIEAQEQIKKETIQKKIVAQPAKVGCLSSLIRIIGGVLVSVFAIFIIGGIITHVTSYESEINDNEVLSYNIVSKDDTSYAGCSRKQYRIIINSSKVPTKSELKETAKKIASLNNFSNINKVFVAIYLPKMNTNDASYASIEFDSGELVDFDINNAALEVSKLPSTNKKTDNSSSSQSNLVNNKIYNLLKIGNIYGVLKVGKTYVLSKKTPLMPSINPDNVKEAIKKIKYIPDGSSIGIINITIWDYAEWYKVWAFGENDKMIGVGWINSGALLGQNIKVK